MLVVKKQGNDTTKHSTIQIPKKCVYYEINFYASNNTTIRQMKC